MEFCQLSTQTGKDFESHDFRAIIMTTKYPGVAYRLGTWFGTKVRLVRLQSLGPNNDNPNYIIQVGSVFGFIISIENVL